MDKLFGLAVGGATWAGFCLLGAFAAGFVTFGNLSVLPGWVLAIYSTFVVLGSLALGIRAGRDAARAFREKR